MKRGNSQKRSRFNQGDIVISSPCDIVISSPYSSINEKRKLGIVRSAHYQEMNDCWLYCVDWYMILMGVRGNITLLDLQFLTLDNHPQNYGIIHSENSLEEAQAWIDNFMSQTEKLRENLLKISDCLPKLSTPHLFEQTVFRSRKEE